jgi:hypothetical protein
MFLSPPSILPLFSVFHILVYRQHTNPLLAQNFPDPSLIRVGDRYYAFATRTPEVNVQVALGADISTWELYQNYDALPIPPAWANKTLPEIWAPDVNRLVSLIGSQCRDLTTTSPMGRSFFISAQLHNARYSHIPTFSTASVPLAQIRCLDPTSLWMNHWSVT